MSFLSRCSRASVPECAWMRFLAQLIQDDLVTEKFTGIVVNHENVDFVGHFSPQIATVENLLNLEDYRKR